MRRRAFTLVELLVVLAVVALLSAMLFPVFSRARDAGRRAVCLSNLHQIGVAFLAYGGDWDETWPNTGDPLLFAPENWWRPFGGYFAPPAGAPTGSLKLGFFEPSPDVTRCPSDIELGPEPTRSSYAYSAAFYYAPAQLAQFRKPNFWDHRDALMTATMPIAAVAQPSRKALMAEWLDCHTGGRHTWYEWGGARCYLFADLHARYIPALTLQPANDELPDINLTVGGILGADI